MTNRASVFSVTDMSGSLCGYAVKIISELRKCSGTVIAVLSDKNEEAQAELQRYADRVIFSPENDLISCYKAGAEHILKNSADHNIDEIVFVNDSFFGPFYGFEDIFKKAEAQLPEADMWGISGFYSLNENKTGHLFELQPYFAVIRKKLISSPAFGEYLKKPAETEECGEFTRFFTSLGFSAGSLFDLSEDRDMPVLEPFALLSSGFPVLLKEALELSFWDIISARPDSELGSAFDFIEKNTPYDTGLIYDHAIAHRDPFELLSALGSHFIISGKASLKNGSAFSKEAVLVFHMHYEDLFEENLIRLNSIAQACNVIITTTSAEKQAVISQMLQQYRYLSEQRPPVLLSMGNGRDMAGLLVEARPYLSGYKYVGFTHDKKSAHHQRLSGEGFKELITENIIPSADFVRGVISLFEENKRLGLLVPPPPEHEKYFAVIGRRWCGNFPYFEELCKKLSIESFASPEWSSFALGTAFWCRYEALKELFEYDWQHSDFPDEPLPLNRSISHALERCFPYIAQKNLYASGFIYSEKFARSFLNSREYILTDFMTMMNRHSSSDSKTYSEYKAETDSLLRDELISSANIKSLKQQIKQRKYQIELIKHSKLFDRKWYLEKYPEVKGSGLSPEEHYLSIGWKEGKDPSANFSTDTYLSSNIDVKNLGINPLIHYEKNGRYEARRLSNDTGNYKAHSLSRAIKRSIGRAVYSSLIKENRSAKILVILHLFYMSSWKEIKEYLKNLDVYDYDLVVTYTPSMADEAVLRNILEYKLGAVLRESDNKGFDVGPFTEVLNDTELDSYDIIFKLQSKGVSRPKIFIYGQYMKKRDWFLNLFEGCIGAFTVHKTIDKLLNDSTVGLAAAKNLITADPSHKQNMVKAFMTERGIPIPDKYLFVAGTCFAVRSSLMQPIKDMGLRLSDYRAAGREFSLAHKMERLICLTVLSSGYEFYGNNVLVLRRALRRLSPDYRIRKKYSGVRLLDDRRFKLDDEFAFFRLEHTLIKKYTLTEIPLKDIRRSWLGKTISLEECHPYKYLQTGDPKIYEEYCRLNKEISQLDIMSKERFDALIESIEKNGFDDTNIVVINSDNILFDGQHRCCYMLYKYGGDHKIPCLKIYEYGGVSAGLKNFLKAHLSEKGFNSLKALYHKFF